MSDLASALEYNVGIDVEDIGRFASGSIASDTLFSEEELAEAEAVRLPERLAGTWCAKEATVKALWPWVQLDPRRVHVTRQTDGRPTVHVTGWDADVAGVQVRVSISHSSTVATAMALVWGRSPAVQTGSTSRVDMHP